MKTLIAQLKEAGFKENVHKDAYDRGNYRVYFDDIDLIIVKWNNPKSQVTEWNSRLNTNMPTDKLLNTINVLTA